MSLRQVLLLTRDVASSTRFFQGIGLKVLPNASEDFAELEVIVNSSSSNNNNRMQSLPTLAIQRVEREADCSTGYSPLLHFDVPDLDVVITNLLTSGGRLDGPIKYPIQGRACAVRSPCGHMVGLFEPNPELQG